MPTTKNKSRQTDALVARFEKRIKRGVKLLTNEMPRWHSKVKITKLDMSCHDRCILGQLFGRYSDGLDEFGLGWHSGRDHGFDIDPVFSVKDVTRSHYKVLTDLWKEAIRNARSNHNSRTRRRTR